MAINNNMRISFGDFWLALFLSLILTGLSLEIDLSKDSSLTAVVNHRNRRNNADNIEITGQINFDKPPQTIPSKSQLKVEFLDARRADASSIKLGQTLVNLAKYKNNTPLFYNMTAPRPKEHGHYSVSAVLNMGWRQAVGRDEWLRSGDYHTITTHHLFVNVTDGVNKYVKDIKLELYIHSAASLDLGNQGLLKASVIVILLAMYFQF